MRISKSAGVIFAAVLFTIGACSSGDDDTADTASDTPEASADAGTAETTDPPEASAAEGGDTGGAETTDPPEASADAGDTGDTAGASPQSMRLGDQEHSLEIVLCNLPDQADGPFSINAETTDGKGSLTVVGVGGLGSANIEYDGVAYRSPGAEPTIDGSTATFAGRAVSGPLPDDAVDFAFNVSC